MKCTLCKKEFDKEGNPLDLHFVNENVVLCKVCMQKIKSKLELLDDMEKDKTCSKCSL